MTTTYTSEQEKIALHVLSKDNSAFYDILDVQKSAEDNEIKKSYRKLAVKLHPDKNPHPKASEAFKKINRAFEVLSDEKKRVIYDQTGRDPDDRVAEAAASGFAGHRHSHHNHPSFEEMFFSRGGGFGPQPEDIFEMFFGGGGGPFGGPFGNAPRGFNFTVHPNMRNRRNMYNQQRQRAQQTANSQGEQKMDTLEMIKIMIPIILFLIIPFIEKLLYG